MVPALTRRPRTGHVHAALVETAAVAIAGGCQQGRERTRCFMPFLGSDAGIAAGHSLVICSLLMSERRENRMSSGLVLVQKNHKHVGAPGPDSH